jgi:hypothetical protein
MINEYRRATKPAKRTRFYEKALDREASTMRYRLPRHHADVAEPHNRGVALASFVGAEPTDHKHFIPRSHVLPFHEFFRNQHVGFYDAVVIVVRVAHGYETYSQVVAIRVVYPIVLLQCEYVPAAILSIDPDHGRAGFPDNMTVGNAVHNAIIPVYL